MTMSDGGVVSPDEEAGLAARAAGRAVPLSAFVERLQGGGVQRVWFFGVRNERCYFEAAGEIALIGEGYPVERAGSPESPLWVMAQVRDRLVPYTMSPLPLKYLRRAGST